MIIELEQHEVDILRMFVKNAIKNPTVKSESLLTEIFESIETKISLCDNAENVKSCHGINNFN